MDSGVLEFFFQWREHRKVITEGERREKRVGVRAERKKSKKKKGEKRKEGKMGCGPFFNNFF